ncbi:DNA-binding response regulator [Brevundimonas intermedia]|jgi:two-component system OmpR family response regulator|uniref:DNA-binding response regulator n=1 Tax=Brevundimonas intermedia TaxID=74315 RepID=A0ABQ5T5D4_9CAUL|nr:response regulator transcription factor [Brevundimonas intermedia]GLK47234.1 DNA-binding response regulator [Brevundimonas intermedia]
MLESSASRILVVDDDAGIRDVLGDYLSQHGFVAYQAGSASEMDEVLASTPVDLIVLDMMMPGEDGLSVCRRMSGKGAPILMLSAMSEETDRIVGLELGAADYIGKPCNPRELLARVRAVLRRQETAQSPMSGTVVTFLGWRLDRVRREITTPSGQEVSLSRSEFVMLEMLVENAGRIVRREQLLAHARAAGRDVNERAMDVQISRLRRKLNEEDSKELIVTVRGEGYLFDAVVENEH